MLSKAYKKSHIRGVDGLLEILFISVIFVISRLPLVNKGFGEADAWRMAISAHKLRFEQIYETSRLPGYPFPEYLYSLVIDYGWIATNTITAVVSLISAIIFYKIVDHHDISGRLVLTLTYILIPAIWINSTNSMDYMYAVSFLVISYYLLMIDYKTFSGIVFGLAIASRLPTVAVIVGFWTLLYTKDDGTKNLISFTAVSGITSIIFFLPLFIQYGLDFIRPAAPSSYTIYEQIFQIGRNTVVSFGLTSLAAIIITLSYLVFLFHSDEKNSVKNRIIPHLAFITPTIVIYILAPWDGDYLLPAIPFSLLLAGEVLDKKKLLYLVCFLLILPSFFSPAYLIFTDSHSVVSQNSDIRMENMEESEYIYSESIEKPNNSIIVVGTKTTHIDYYQRSGGDCFQSRRCESIDYSETNISFRYLVDRSVLETGRPVYYTEEGNKYSIRVHQFNLSNTNAKRINVSANN